MGFHFTSNRYYFRLSPRDEASMDTCKTVIWLLRITCTRHVGATGALGAISHTPCVYNGIHISYVVLNIFCIFTYMYIMYIVR